MSNIQDREEKMKGYLERANPMIERLIIDLLIDLPDNLIDFSKNWFDTKGRQIEQGYVPKSKQEEEIKVKTNPQIDIHETSGYGWNNNPNDQSHHHKHQLETLPAPIQYDGMESEEDEEDDDGYDEKLKLQMQQKKTQGARSSVSAESYGSFNQKKAYVPKVIQKSQEVKDRILQKLNTAFMFKALEHKDKEIVLNAMEECKYSIGDTVIQQGEDGEVLYVVDEGDLDCFKVFKVGDAETYLKTYKPGEAFGELALLYNAPRAATIRAKTQAICFSLDRACFNGIVKDAAQQRRERFDRVLQKVELLSHMDPYERVQLCDGLTHQHFGSGEVIIQQGDSGDNFYIVEAGNLKAFRKLEGETEEKEVLEYKSGDYFGELSLIRDIPRQATVKSEGEVDLIFLERNTFKRLLGPIEDLLKRNEDKYAKFWNADQAK